MNAKLFIYFGIVLLLGGIGLKAVSDLTLLPIILISAGALCKLSYLFLAIKKGTYRPGFELVLLLAGLILFFSGKRMQVNDETVYSTVFMISGISLKLFFIFLFIRKIRMGLSKK